MATSKKKIIEGLKEFNKKSLVQALTDRGLDAKESELKDVLLERLADDVIREQKEAEKKEKEGRPSSSEDEVKKKPETKPASKKQKKKKKPDAKVAKIKKERSEAIKNIEEATVGATEDKKTLIKGTGSDAELRPRQVRNAPENLSISGGRANLNEQEENDDIDLTESLNNPSVILSGQQIFAMENPTPWVTKRSPITGEMESFYQIAAVVQYNSRLVYIPAEFYLEDYYEMPQSKIKSYVEERGGAEVDFRVVNVFAEGDEPIYVGSRIAAMKKIRCDYWYSERQKGQALIQPGKIHEAKIVAVSDGQLFAELFGAEIRINARDITWNHVDSLKELYTPGSTEFVKVKSATLVDRGRAEALGYPVSCELSIKEAKPDPRDKYFKQNLKGMSFNGEVRHSRVDENQVTWYYVEIGKTKYEEGVTVMCRLGDRISKIPRNGDRVSGKITFSNDKQKRLFGTIYHIDPPIRRAGVRR